MGFPLFIVVCAAVPQSSSASAVKRSSLTFKSSSSPFCSGFCGVQRVSLLVELERV